MEDALNELDMEIEAGEYTGPGSGKARLANGEADPNDRIKSEVYYEVLVTRFYSEWKDMFGSEVIHDKEADAQDQCDRMRLKSRMQNGGCLSEYFQTCKRIKAFYTTHKESFPKAKMWQLFLKRMKPRSLRKLIQVDKEFYQALQRAEYNFYQFATKVKKDYKIDVRKRADSATNAPHDDPPEQKDFMTDDEGVITKVKSTTKSTKKNNFNSNGNYTLPDVTKLNKAARVQDTSYKKKRKKNQKAEVQPISAEKAAEQLDMTEAANKAFYNAKDGDLKGACPLGPHKEFTAWDKCTCIKGAN